MRTEKDHIELGNKKVPNTLPVKNHVLFTRTEPSSFMKSSNHNNQSSQSGIELKLVSESINDLKSILTGQQSKMDSGFSDTNEQLERLFELSNVMKTSIDNLLNLIQQVVQTNDRQEKELDVLKMELYNSKKSNSIRFRKSEPLNDVDVYNLNFDWNSNESNIEDQEDVTIPVLENILVEKEAAEEPVILGPAAGPVAHETLIPNTGMDEKSNEEDTSAQQATTKTPDFVSADRERTVNSESNSESSACVKDSTTTPESTYPRNINFCDLLPNNIIKPVRGRAKTGADDSANGDIPSKKRERTLSTGEDNSSVTSDLMQSKNEIRYELDLSGMDYDKLYVLSTQGDASTDFKTIPQLYEERHKVKTSSRFHLYCRLSELIVELTKRQYSKRTIQLGLSYFMKQNSTHTWYKLVNWMRLSEEKYSYVLSEVDKIIREKVGAA